ncbi:Peptidase family M28 [Desulfatibacillum alkenivorans DSM 16219]|uniref:Peptidase family M28 n=1 Tax=Desulfatibacillum alkenivorans DSM 16219 TaxID=1121393 RepID=A0A1M6PCP2_9BACT|nr:Peptidase family M28 [Desulfatibacillum alkenivorans DSM 16219]
MPPMHTNKFYAGLLLLLAFLISLGLPGAGLASIDHDGMRKDTAYLSSLGDRSTGSEGCVQASAFIAERFKALGLEDVESLDFRVPILEHRGSSLSLGADSRPVALNPIYSNAIAPQSFEDGVSGPVVYAGKGGLQDLQGKKVAGCIMLMDMESGKNWQNAASLGAKALIYVGDPNTSKIFFQEKFELTPYNFPRFWMTRAEAREVFGDYESAPRGLAAENAELKTSMAWEQVKAQNIYGFMKGTDENLKQELLVVEAFYDSTALVFGKSPGADEAGGIVALLELIRILKENPPPRSVLFVATAGHAQGLAGARELWWSLCTKNKVIKGEKARLEQVIEDGEKALESLDAFSDKFPTNREDFNALRDAVSEELKTQVDAISNKLMRLRLADNKDEKKKEINKLAEKRMALRSLLWVPYKDLTDQDRELMHSLINPAQKNLKYVVKDANKQRKIIKTARAFRKQVGEYKVVSALSLHLSSHGDGAGGFSQGWHYSLKDGVNRTSAYKTLDKAMQKAGAKLKENGMEYPLADTLRPSGLRTWQSWFGDKPALSGEVGALAGYPSASFVTINDSRPMWGTPFDTIDNMDWNTASKQAEMVLGVLEQLAFADELHSGKDPKLGFSTVTGHAKFMRHGELFADQAAPKTTILCFQGPSIIHVMTDALGDFQLKGMADKKHSTDKAILEGYRFDENGQAYWAIDKETTGKDAYRVKVLRKSAETDLIMFSCRQTTLFNLLEPRSFWPMTKIQLIDARQEAEPRRFWYSRIDTRTSVLASIFMPPQSRFKLTLSDTVLKKKLVLTNATEGAPEGVGFSVDDQDVILNTEQQAAKDMWALLGPRIDSLESHGIYNDKLRELMDDGTAALDSSKQFLKSKQYARAYESAKKSWALASRVYDDVEKTQKDVLFGVLFYIALFVPFAFCMERLLFSFADIHRRIIAFMAILAALIFVIYKVHPAFQLAYSPMVVVLAFFIIGLSLVVSLIIFFRFEEEMTLLQKRASHVRAAEMGRWQAFSAAFFLGVSNLRRRRLRTTFTCITLIILTFTIMSFTSIQSLRYSFSRLFMDTAPYNGLLLKNINWRDLPPEARETLRDALAGKGVSAPRVWLEVEDKTRPLHITVRRGEKVFAAAGLVGLASTEPEVTGIGKELVGGRWLDENDSHAVLLPERMAEALDIDPKNPTGAVTLWGEPFDVAGVFSSRILEERRDLDDEMLTPVYFPGEISAQMSEVEAAALESGEDVKAFQSRYQHVEPNLTVIMPHTTVMAMGGGLKGIAFKPAKGVDVKKTAAKLVDRFKLSIFLGEPKGVFVYHASDTLSYSGVPNIAIPIIIAALIVLNTMIGTVYERKREIGIYTSVGLAPSHVAFLFVAESMAFAVISVVLGYVVAQTAAALFSGTSLWAGLTVNYSSLAGVAAMILVFAVVLISVIYPSRVAARIAIPDVNRSWSLPDAEKNVINVSMPVLIRYDEVQGIGGFIADYFASYQDVSHGIFSTNKMEVAPHCQFMDFTADAVPILCTENQCEKRHCLHLKVKAWLAPFDFGIMQRVDIYMAPSEDDPYFLEIRTVLTREAGETNAWKRINKVFVNQLRKQLLVWRSLTPEEKIRYTDILNNAMNSRSADE